MRRRLSSTFAAIGVLLAGSLLLAGCGGGDGSTNAAVSGRTLPTRSITAGDVTVKVTPIRLDARGAVFTVVFDTHSRELDLDVAKAARLSVGGSDWQGPTYTGDGPGGHHREGELRFSASGPVGGSARLVISGLPEPVTAEWSLGR